MGGLAPGEVSNRLNDLVRDRRQPRAELRCLLPLRNRPPPGIVRVKRRRVEGSVRKPPKPNGRKELRVRGNRKRTFGMVRARIVDGTTPDELKASAGQPLGTLSFRLLSVSEKNASLAGQKVQVKGVLSRQSTVERINVMSLESVATACRE